MNWLSLILQLVALRKGMHESRSMIEAAKHYAEIGKRAVAATMAAAVAGLFVFSGIVVAVIELGIEIDRGEIRYSGLMVSATILIAIGLLFLFGAWLLGRSEPPPPPPRESLSPRADRIKDILEEFAVSFLQQLVKPAGEGKKDKTSEKKP